MPILQIHLISARTRRAIAIHAAAVAGATAKGAPVPPLPALDFAHYSGRGVRLRELSPEETSMAIECAAKAVGPDATGPEYSSRKLREGIYRMIAEVTEQGELADLGGAAWTRVTQFELEDPKGTKRFGALFTTKDSEMLGALFNRLHSITAEDLDAVEGNAVEVSD